MYKLNSISKTQPEAGKIVLVVLFFFKTYHKQSHYRNIEDLSQDLMASTNTILIHLYKLNPILQDVQKFVGLTFKIKLAQTFVRWTANFNYTLHSSAFISPRETINFKFSEFQTTGIKLIVNEFSKFLNRIDWQ